MAKVTSPFTPINLDGVEDLPEPLETKGNEISENSETNKKLDRILEQLEQTGEGFNLVKKEFNLKYDVAQQNMSLQKVEFYVLLVAKILLFIFVIALVSAIAYKLYCLFGKASIGDLMIFDKTHVLLAIIVGCFLTMFGLLAVLLKGLGQKDKMETPIAVEEVLKALLNVFKSTKQA